MPWPTGGLLRRWWRKETEFCSRSCDLLIERDCCSRAVSTVVIFHCVFLWLTTYIHIMQSFTLTLPRSSTLFPCLQSLTYKQHLVTLHLNILVTLHMNIQRIFRTISLSKSTFLSPVTHRFSWSNREPKQIFALRCVCIHIPQIHYFNKRCIFKEGSQNSENKLLPSSCPSLRAEARLTGRRLACVFTNSVCVPRFYRPVLDLAWILSSTCC
jgi:hypothetical protein